MPKAKKIKTQVVVTVPRAGEFLMTVPVPVEHATTKEAIARYVYDAILPRLKMKVPDAAAIVRRVKTTALRG